MDNTQSPVLKDLVLIGGGHAHVFVLKRFGMQPVPGVRLTMIARDIHTPYSGMLPGFIAGHYAYDECHIDLRPLAEFAGARLYRAEATAIDLENRRVICADRPPVPYDVLSIDIGSHPRQHDVPGARENTVPVKPINRFAEHWKHLAERVVAATQTTRIGIVGGGAGGLELALALQHRLQRLLLERRRAPDQVSIHLITAGDLLPEHPVRARSYLSDILVERGIQVYRQHAVTAVEPRLIRCDNGATIHLDEILWVTQAGAAPWPAESGLDCDERGFIKVHDTLQSLTDPRIFAAGDIAEVVGHPRPKAGVFAVRQGAPLAENLRRVLGDLAPKPFTPQKRQLALISTGNRFAVASWGPLALKGAWLWQLKDRIDRRFMRKFSDLPDMTAPSHQPPRPAKPVQGTAIAELSAIAMRCGGCGAKVGATVLSRVVDQLAPVVRDDVVIGLGEPDDAAIVRVPDGKLVVQTIDFFRAFIGDPYRFGQIAANHSLGDVYAMGAEPQTALAIATVPFGLEAKVEDDLFQMMSGALSVLNASGTALVGGHSSEGRELGLGFAVNGLVAPRQVLRKGGLRPGQALILTKPIGTGVLFAANMRGKAKGRWIEAALESMLQSSGAAAACVRRHGATACTDVTGFGLLGHLVEMIKASSPGVDVELRLDTVPLLEGALDGVAAGIFSSLQPQNVRLRRAVRDSQRSSRDPRSPLLFDPQTAGGLLVSLPSANATECVAELKRLGYRHAATIGEVQSQSEALEPIVLR